MDKTLTDAMLEHLADIVYTQHRPITYKDFLSFEVDGKEYGMKSGTFRNKISALMKEGVVELDYHSNMAFYTLKGHKFGKRMTPYHTGVNTGANRHRKAQLTKLIEELPLGDKSLHNIRLRFRVEGLWNLFHGIIDANNINEEDTFLAASQNSKPTPNFGMIKKSKDIAVSTLSLNDLLIRITVHKTDTITVTVACSLNPVAMNTKGLFNLASALTKVEELLKHMITDTIQINQNKRSIDNKHPSQTMTIPSYATWIVTMWHFGRDSKTEYIGDKFSICMEDALDVLVRVYTKEINNKTRIRLDRQEYPNKTFVEAINERLL